MPILRSLMRAPLLVALALVLLPGCATYRSLFPRREEVFKPIAPTLGERIVEGGDTLYALEGGGYEIVTRRRDLLVEAKATLDRAAKSYVRYFGDAPGTVRVALVPVDPRARRGVRPAADSALASRGGRRVTLLVPVLDDGRGPPMMGTVSATAVVYEWVAERYGGEGALLPPDTIEGRPASWRDHPKLPDWMEVALPELVAGSSRADMLIGRLASQTNDIMPLVELLSARRPAEGPAAREGDGVSADGPGAETGRARGRAADRGSRRGRGARGPLTGAALFDAQALALGRFLLQREGAPFIGATADVLARGVAAEEVLSRVAGAPSMGTIDAEWRAWVARQRGAFPGPR